MVWQDRTAEQEIRRVKMSRTRRRAGTKTKVIPGRGEKKPPKFKFPQRTKYHRKGSK